MQDRSSQQETRRSVLVVVRYVLPGVVSLAGLVIMAMGSETDLEGGASILSAGLGIYLINWLFRIGAAGEPGGPAPRVLRPARPLARRAAVTGEHRGPPEFLHSSKVKAHPARENPRVSSRAPTPALDARGEEQAIDSYRPQAPFLDELFELDGTPRPTARALVEELRRLGPAGLIEAGRRRDAIFMQQGITFETSGGGGATHERPFPLDLVPRVLSGQEWRDIKRGLAQRIRALNHFVDDVYHAREIVREGLVPWRLVVSCSHFARAVHGI